MSDIHRLALHIFIVSVITRILDPPHVRAWRCHIAASALNVTFARTIAWCLSTMSWAVNTVLSWHRCYETPHRPHRPHRPQIQVLGIGKMCLVRCILLISIKKRTGYGFHAFLTCMLLLLLLIQYKISLYLGPVRCFVTPVIQSLRGNSSRYCVLLFSHREI